MINERIFKQVAISDHTHRILLYLQYKLSHDGKKPTMAELIDKAVDLLDKEVNKE
jgi:hypothetical protein